MEPRCGSTAREPGNCDAGIEDAPSDVGEFMAQSGEAAGCDAPTDDLSDIEDCDDDCDDMADLRACAGRCEAQTSPVPEHHLRRNRE